MLNQLQNTLQRNQLRQNVLNWLENHVSAPRIKHILRTEQMAESLAMEYGLDVHKASVAALMHDLAKYFSSEKLLNMAEANGLTIDPVLAAHPHLLHADVSAIVAKEEFGIDDPQILQAIANHTLGSPQMDSLSCIIYLADTLEPGRGHSTELDALRQLSYNNLAKAVWRTSDYSLKYLLEQERLIHPRTIATRNWFLQEATKSNLTVLSEI